MLALGLARGAPFDNSRASVHVRGTWSRTRSQFTDPCKLEARVCGGPGAWIHTRGQFAGSCKVVAGVCGGGWDAGTHPASVSKILQGRGGCVPAAAHARPQFARPRNLDPGVLQKAGPRATKSRVCFAKCKNPPGVLRPRLVR